MMALKKENMRDKQDQQKIEFAPQPGGPNGFYTIDLRSFGLIHKEHRDDELVCASSDVKQEAEEPKKEK